MSKEWWTGKEFEGCNHGWTEVLTQHLAARTEEDHEQSQCG
jgi:hypothetical protein